MAKTSCSGAGELRLPQQASPRSCGGDTARRTPGLTHNSNVITSSAHNLTLDDLAARLRGLGPLEEQQGYCYVIRTVRLQNGTLVQTASAPNFDGGYITLCTCKHSMRATMPVEAWEAGVWVAGMNRWDIESRKRQGLVYMMRIGEAYNSHFELVRSFNQSGRAITVELKTSTTNPRGDVMLPRSNSLAPNTYRLSSSYQIPMLGHAHRKDVNDSGWTDDITYESDDGVPAALLVGDPAYSFTWSKQLIRNKRPGSLRPYRRWDLGMLLSNLEDFPS